MPAFLVYSSTSFARPQISQIGAHVIHLCVQASPDATSAWIWKGPPTLAGNVSDAE
jgi:hypothetical protein